MKMKKFLSVLFVVIALFATTNQAQASGLQFGVKAGLTVNDLKFNSDVFNADNRCGYTVGLMTKFTVPVINIGFDASLMYTHRSSFVDGIDDGSEVSGTYNSNYIEVPINFRWDISLPVIGSYVSPFLTTGPDFSFQVSKDNNITDQLKDRSFNFAWNVGFGLMFVNKVQVHASYGFGLSNTTSSDSSSNSSLYDSKNRFWTISAAYLF